MNFPFPNINKKCLVCGTICKARWKGYYVRQIIHELYIGPIAIHVGHCFKNKKDFSYVPNFIIPGRKLSRPSFTLYLKTYCQTRNVKNCIDDLNFNQRDSEDLHIPLSTAYNWIYQSIRTLRINASDFAIVAPLKLSVFVYYKIFPSVVDNLFLVQRLWHPFHHIIIHPP
jgi:hypothetical protein